MHTTQQQRVVHNEQLRTLRHGPFGDLQRAIQRERNLGHLSIRITANQANLVPTFRQRRRVGSLEGINNVLHSHSSHGSQPTNLEQW